MILSIMTILFLLMASITDLKFNKVKNSHILIAVFIGFFFNSLSLGIEGSITAFVGLIIPLIIGYPLFLFGFIPAGDIKLFMAFGAMNGINVTGYLLIITLLLGGVYSIILLFRSKDFSGFISFYRYIKVMIITRQLSPYVSKKSIKFPLAPVTFISYLVFIFLFDML